MWLIVVKKRNVVYIYGVNTQFNLFVYGYKFLWYFNKVRSFRNFIMSCCSSLYISYCFSTYFLSNCNILIRDIVVIFLWLLLCHYLWAQSERFAIVLLVVLFWFVNLINFFGCFLQSNTIVDFVYFIFIINFNFHVSC